MIQYSTPAGSVVSVGRVSITLSVIGKASATYPLDCDTRFFLEECAGRAARDPQRFTQWLDNAVQTMLRLRQAGPKHEPEIAAAMAARRSAQT